MNGSSVRSRKFDRMPLPNDAGGGHPYKKTALHFITNLLIAIHCGFNIYGISKASFATRACQHADSLPAQGALRACQCFRTAASEGNSGNYEMCLAVRRNRSQRCSDAGVSGIAAR
jgi:hypothetical protein